MNLAKVRTQTIQVLSQSGAPHERDAKHSKTPTIDQMEVPPQLRDAQKALEVILREKEAALQQQEYGLAAELRACEVRLRERIARLESDWHRERDDMGSVQEAGEENVSSTQQPIQDDDDTVRELSQEEKAFIKTPGALSQDDGNRFDKFTERARKVLGLAQEEAQRLQHHYIGTEHLLLGLLRDREGIAAKVLSNLGVEINKVRSAVEFIIGRGDRIMLGEIGLTPRVKKVIELAADEARHLAYDYIGPEHLLLGLVREGEGIAAGVLESLGVRLEKVRTETLKVLNQ